MKVEQFKCNELAENCYVAYDEATLDAIIIDPGMQFEHDWNAVKDFVSDNNLKVRHILITHYHFDHILGSGRCVDEFGIELSGSLEESLSLPIPRMQATLFGYDYDCKIAGIKNDLKEDDKLLCGSHVIEVLDCPGHSFHGLCYYLPEDNIVFTGDVLFFCSVGRSDFGRNMGCDGKKLIDTIKAKLLTLPDNTIVWPGHGQPTMIGNEKIYNPFINN